MVVVELKDRSRPKYKSTTLQKEMNKLLNKLQKHVSIRHNQNVLVCWDKCVKMYKNYTLHHGRHWTIYLTDGPMCKHHRQYVLAGKLDSNLIVDKSGKWYTKY